MASNTSSSSLVTRRYLSNRIAIALSMVATAFGLFFLAAILITLLWKGVAALDWATFTEETPAPPGDDGGGLSNAIFGSFMMTLIGIVIATPIGLMAGTYLSEYSRGSKIGEAAKFINDVLLSAPSIIIGLFIYGLLVVPFGHQSAWAGAVALAVIAVPIINRTTQDMLALVPNAMREAAAALGAPRWKVMVSVVWRSARSGITTGVLLAVARISGETAPLLFTAGSNQFWSTNLNDSMANLPVIINNFATGGYEALQRLAWGGALLITVTILILNIVARALAGHRSA